MKILFHYFCLSFVFSQSIFSQPKNENVHNAEDFIIGIFDDYDLVAIGETHGLVEVTDLYLSLVNNEEFRQKVDFVVIEMGNHLFQEVLDDYVSGKEVDKSNLYKLWRDHTSCTLNDSDNTGMIRFLSAVREANKTSEHKLRVLAGDPDIDWTKINCLQEFYKYLGNRDNYYTQIVEEYIVDNPMKGLLIMGNGHFNKQKTNYMIEKKLDNPITSLQTNVGSKLYLLNIIASSSFPYSKLRNIQPGNVITTNDSWLGQLKPGSPFLSNFSLAEQTDAIIYLGNKEDLKHEKETPFNEAAYEKEFERRGNLQKCNKQ